MKNLTEIKHSDEYLLSVLIFGYPHRLLWESVLFRQYLTINTKNFLTFIVQDVSNLPQCLSEGYPCVNSQSEPTTFISVCCSNMRCEQSNNNQLQGYTCGGRPPVIIIVNITFTLPAGIVPQLGTVDQVLLEMIRKQVS
ncbi:unnamed protein product [Rotaria sp. Silwood2]|nr:unnamed protein product [Rotaria sp. Silwood2]